MQNFKQKNRDKCVKNQEGGYDGDFFCAFLLFLVGTVIHIASPPGKPYTSSVRHRQNFLKSDCFVFQLKKFPADPGQGQG